MKIVEITWKEWMIISLPKELFTFKKYSNSVILLQRLLFDH